MGRGRDGAIRSSLTRHNALVAQMRSDLDDGAADFDIDASTISYLGLKLDVQVVVPETETAGEQQLADVGLHGRLAAHSLAISKTAQQLTELVRRGDQLGGHGDGLPRCYDSRSVRGVQSSTGHAAGSQVRPGTPQPCARTIFFASRAYRPTNRLR